MASSNEPLKVFSFKAPTKIVRDFDDKASKADVSRSHVLRELMKMYIKGDVKVVVTY
jgi:hypothetical protein